MTFVWIDNGFRLDASVSGSAYVDIELIPSFCISTDYALIRYPNRYPVLNSDPDPADDAYLPLSGFRSRSRF
ncbi:hypothetical protein EVAR_66362_1 [Eumeta japonica]|uniref:Uncharacterized protein n=1 Tax=Eumeta variegata TaxID=151549 RepID=A0A4C1ZJL3_EUMVA|nr:hypothetical protein EVAR_66362_1 [Eumeta japonica]